MAHPTRAKAPPVTPAKPKTVNDLSLREARDALFRIVDAMYPDDDPSAEWSSDTLDKISVVIDMYGLVPPDVPVSNVTSQGNITIPRVIHRQCPIEPGELLAWEVIDEDTIQIRRHRDSSTIS
jgi:hypothetical protein